MMTKVFIHLLTFVWVFLETSANASIRNIDPRCPFPNPLNYTLHLPHETDCSKFYKCDHGELVLFDCPDNLYFSEALQRCEWPSNVNCVSAESTTANASISTETTSSIPSRPPVVTSTSAIPSLSTAVPSSTPNIPSRPPVTTTPSSIPSIPFSTGSPSSPAPSAPSGECPLPDPEYPVYLADLLDPAKFYECSNGVPYPFYCKEGLHFNPYLNVCDYPGFTAPSTTTTAVPLGPSGTCPFPDPEYPVYLTDLSDPSKFYECSNGVPYPFYCPEGLHFNPYLNVCDNPGFTSPPPVASSSISTAVPLGPSGTCPFPDPEYPVYLADLSDPSKFYECSNGVPYPLYCKDGLHFNPYLNVCDYPGFTAPSTTTTTAPSGPSGSCPFPDPEYPVYLTDLSDPTKFYECSNGIPYPFECPIGLHFNPDLNVCAR